MTVKLRYDLSGSDSTCLSSCHRFYTGLCGLELYHQSRPDKVVSLELLKEGIDRYQKTYEGGTNGDRVQIAMRKKARKEVTNMFQKILHYLQAIAEEEDIPALLQAGIEVVQRAARRRAVAPVTG